MAVERTVMPAFETMLDHVDCGHIAASVPVVMDGEACLFTTAGCMPEPRDDLDVLAQVFTCIRHARDQAERHGAHPLP